MAIDQVHDLQLTYRNLLHSMSRPGTISSVEKAAAQADYKLPCYDTTLISAMALLDAEVTFYILSEARQDLIEKISEYTLARFAPAEEADYVIVLRDDTEAAIIETLQKCKNGSLADPQESATWIIESSPMSNDGEMWLAGGPGMKDTLQLDVSFTTPMWEARNE